MQYTIRGIPPDVDDAVRKRAREGGKSLNEAAIDALAEGSGLRRKRRSVGDVAGTWRPDKALEKALAVQDCIDADMWR